MNALAMEQRALLDALFIQTIGARSESATNNIAANAYFTGARGLKAYQNNAFSLAGRTLQSAYPVIAQLLGEETFALVARDFWHTNPPVRGDLAQWGTELGDFMQNNVQLADEPYLGDVARVEWALHCAASAADLDAQPATFTLLSTAEPDTVTLQLSISAFALASVYPVASIVAAHLYGSPALEEVGRQLRAGEGEGAVVWRRGFKPEVARCTAAQAGFVQALQSGASLLSALALVDDVEVGPAFDFNLWLPAAVQNGLVLGVKSLCQPLNNPSMET